MASVTLTGAKTQLSANNARVASGNTVPSACRGRSEAEIDSITREPIDPVSLWELTDSMPEMRISARLWMRQVREEERY